MTIDPTAALDALKQRFLARAADDLAQLEVYRAGRGIPLKDFSFLIHRLAGAAGTFGYPKLSAAASSVEDNLLAGASRSSPAIERLVDELKATLPSQAEKNI